MLALRQIARMLATRRCWCTASGVSDRVISDPVSY
jgi:hypothetical protein